MRYRSVISSFLGPVSVSLGSVGVFMATFFWDERVDGVDGFVS